MGRGWGSLYRRGRAGTTVLRVGARGEDPVIRSIVTLEAGLEPGVGLDRVERSSASHVVVRRPVGAVSWFVFTAEFVCGQLGTQVEAPHLSAALHLADVKPTKAVSPQDLGGLDVVPEPLLVVTKGGRVLGLLETGQEVPDVFRILQLTRTVDSAPRRSASQHSPSSESVTFNADASLGAPERVSLNAPFTVTIDLANPAALATGARLSVNLDPGVTEFELDVQLFADGFEAAHAMRGKIAVDATRVGESSVSFELTAVSPPPEVLSLVESGEATDWQASITAFFLYRGMPAGSLVHRLFVDLDPNQNVVATKPSSGARTDVNSPASVVLSLPDLPEPDLTIVVSSGGLCDDSDGRFTIHLSSPHGTVPSTSFDLHLGKTARAFAAGAMSAIPSSDGTAIGWESLEGIGARIARLVKREFWEYVNATLATAQEASGEVPTVLLMTSDPYIPWELAHLGGSFIDPAAPPFLAAQARVGRWILDPDADIPIPPYVDLHVDNMVAIIGEYGDLGSWPRLPQAEAEGAFLRDEYGARYLSAVDTDIERLLNGSLRPSAQMMHFACHGKAESGSNALLMNDGREIGDHVFELSAAGRDDRPFVFLNACRVGAASSELNQYGGFAAAFLRSGCTGFVGPLWEVDDKVAHEIAVTFYASLAKGEAPAEALRATRAKFVDVEGVPDPPSTYMAYVYYGHPNATISGLRKKALT